LKLRTKKGAGKTFTLTIAGDSGALHHTTSVLLKLK